MCRRLHYLTPMKGSRSDGALPGLGLIVGVTETAQSVADSRRRRKGKALMTLSRLSQLTRPSCLPPALNKMEAQRLLQLPSMDDSTAAGTPRTKLARKRTTALQREEKAAWLTPKKGGRPPPALRPPMWASTGTGYGTSDRGRQVSFAAILEEEALNDLDAEPSEWPPTLRATGSRRGWLLISGSVKPASSNKHWRPRLPSNMRKNPCSRRTTLHNKFDLWRKINHRRQLLRMQGMTNPRPLQRMPSRMMTMQLRTYYR